MKPIIALAMGDPAGISPELTARLLALDEVAAKARLVVIGDRRVLDDGARVAAVELDLKNVSPDSNFSEEDAGPVFIDLGHLDPASVKRSTATAEGGRFALANYRHALTLARDGRVDAVCFTPFNKNAMRLAHSVYDDEISFSADVVGLERAGERVQCAGPDLECARHLAYPACGSRGAHHPGARAGRAEADPQRDARRRIRPSADRRRRVSIRTPAMAAISAVRRSTPSGPRSNKPGRKVS